MHWSDLLIIYLSCGAPFGVHHFLQGRNKRPVFGLFARSCGISLLWAAYAYLLWRKNIAKRLTKREIFSPDPQISLLGQQISMLQEQILQAFVELNAETGSKLNFFAFRDVLERYAGLTLALKADETTAGESDFEVFRIAGRKKKELPLAGKCLARKNSMRLKSHQCNAREDFLKLLAKLAFDAVPLKSDGGYQNSFALKELILELFELIDVNTLRKVESAFGSHENAPGELIQESKNGFQTSEVTKCQPPVVEKPKALPAKLPPQVPQSILMTQSSE
jgi:hypothetical protein